MESMRKNRGATLIESLVAVLIFLIAALGWLSMEASLAQQSGQSHLISQAVFVGQSNIDRLRQMPYADVQSQVDPIYYTSEGEFSQGADSDFFAVTWNVAEVGDPPIKNLNMMVSWNVYDADFDNSIELNFVRSQ